MLPHHNIPLVSRELYTYFDDTQLVLTFHARIAYVPPLILNTSLSIFTDIPQHFLVRTHWDRTSTVLCVQSIQITFQYWTKHARDIVFVVRVYALRVVAISTLYYSICAYTLSADEWQLLFLCFPKCAHGCATVNISRKGWLMRFGDSCVWQCRVTIPVMFYTLPRLWHCFRVNSYKERPL